MRLPPTPCVVFVLGALCRFGRLHTVKYKSCVVKPQAKG